MKKHKLPYKITPVKKKYPTPLHKRIAKLEKEYADIEKDYKTRYDKWFLDGKGPRPKKRALRMARIEKQTASILRKMEKLKLIKQKPQIDPGPEPGVLVPADSEKLIKEVDSDTIAQYRN